MALLVMAGSTVPCCYDDNCADESTTSSHGEESPENNACSPFFACGTCPGFVQMTRQVSIPAPITQRPAHYQKGSGFIPSLYYSAFFQPPRV